MRITHGRLSAELPDGWNDETLMVFTAPEAKVAVPLHKAAQKAPERANIVLRRQEVTMGEPDLERFAAAQEQMMAAIGKELKVLARETVELEGVGVTGLTREFSFQGPVGYLQQLQIYFAIDDDVFVFAATGPMGEPFAPVRKLALDVARSLRVSE